MTFLKPHVKKDFRVNAPKRFNVRKKMTRKISMIKNKNPSSFDSATTPMSKNRGKQPLLGFRK